MFSFFPVTANHSSLWGYRYVLIATTGSYVPSEKEEEAMESPSYSSDV